MASGEVSATTRLEEDKIYLKHEACARRTITFFPVAFDSMGAMGDRAHKVILDGYAEKMATVKSDGERWAIVFERQTVMSTLSVIVQRYNATVFYANAHPLAGGFVPPGRRPEGGAEEGDGVDAMGM